jgi:hypothetical protein
MLSATALSGPLEVRQIVADFIQPVLSLLMLGSGCESD